MIPWKAHIKDFPLSLRKYKELAQKVFHQVEDQEFFKKPCEHSDRIATITKHVSGNLPGLQRWLNFPNNYMNANGS